nr:replication protein [Raoultella ornithinolytica]
MANTAEVINFPVPVVALQELRVADLDDGFTRIANELLEAVMLAGLSQHQLWCSWLSCAKHTASTRNLTGSVTSSSRS